jgi:AAA domain/DnaB-like helicase N terminal domain
VGRVTDAVAPQNLEAEESVLGAILLAGARGIDASAETVARVRATGLAPDDFYIGKNGIVFAAALAVAERGEPADVLVVERELRSRRKLSAAGGTPRLHELAALVPATKNAAHFARLVVGAAEQRQEADVARALRVAADNGGLAANPELRERLAELLGPRRSTSVERLPGLSNEAVRGLKVPPTQEIVAGLIEAGTVGTIASLPEMHKSWLATQITHKVAAGGQVLGRFKVVRQGPVGYWWQDDSEQNEVRRIQTYAARHNCDIGLPICWHLNEGLRLPDDLPLLRAEIEREGQVLAVLDSLYNFLSGVSFKDEDVAAVYAAIKTEVCDQTGAAILSVDHAPWPTEGNRGQRRAYGSVFKAAAIRSGVYLDREEDTLYVEARGNNINGLKRTAVIWDSERMELQLVEPLPQEADLSDRIGDFLKRNPGAATHVVVAGVEGNDGAIRARLRADDRFVTVPPIVFGKPRNTKCWARAEDAPDLLGTRRTGATSEPEAASNNLGRDSGRR